MSDVLRQRLYGHGGRAQLWKGDNDCEYLYADRPSFGQQRRGVRFDTRGFLKLGVPLGDQCLAPVTWSGIIEADTAPYIAGFALKLHVTDVNLYDRDHKETLLLGHGFDLIKSNLTPALETYSFDLTPAIRELDGLAQMSVLPADEAALHLALATLRLEPAVIVEQSGVQLTMTIDLPPQAPATPIAASAAPLTPDEITAWNTALDNWDAFLVFAIKQVGATVTDPNARNQLLNILLDSRQRLVAALAQPQRLTGPDPVRLLFVEEWTRLGRVIEKASEQGRLGNRSLEFLSFISAGDALFALDQAASTLGLRISAGDLRRLARIMAPHVSGDPLVYSFDEDPQLRSMFGLGAPLAQPGALEAPAKPSGATPANGGDESPPFSTGRVKGEAPTGPAGGPATKLPLESTPLSTTISPASGPLSGLFSGLCTLGASTALAAEIVPNTAVSTGEILTLGRKLQAVVVNQNNVVSYGRDLGQLLDLAARYQLEDDIDVPGRGLWPDLLKAAAWQESCWRQYVIKNGRIWFLESKSGDIGLMQVNKYVWRGFYSLPSLRWDIVYNLSGGSQILHRFLTGASEHLHSSDPAVLARAAYAAYNGGPGAYNRWRQPHEPRLLREIDVAFWLKYQAVAAGQRFDILTCASQWDRLHAE
ncbi:MAG: transglycosylase SLT domain-containing protein [Deltaproteobacteria bacterium]|nr:transglycosylase SLT domain-containing protein [Deltaproteobacteria bacterium]